MTSTSDDIRRLLRSFGIQADEAIQERVREAGAAPALKLRIILEDLTEYGGTGASSPARVLEVEGEVSI